MRTFGRHCCGGLSRRKTKPPQVAAGPGEGLELEMAAARAAARAGLMESAAGHYDRAAELAETLGDGATRRRAIAGRAGLLLEGQDRKSVV